MPTFTNESHVICLQLAICVLVLRAETHRIVLRTPVVQNHNHVSKNGAGVCIIGPFEVEKNKSHALRSHIYNACFSVLGQRPLRIVPRTAILRNQ
jgi:hypothetical protein